MAASTGDADKADTQQLLFVEADIVVRSAIASYLRECGYTVIEATSTDEAMALVGRDDLAIRIVLADVDTPGSIDGFGLARWIAAEHPTVRMILSATVQREARLAADLCAEGPQLRKPYEHAALLDLIKRMR